MPHSHSRFRWIALCNPNHLRAHKWKGAVPVAAARAKCGATLYGTAENDRHQQATGLATEHPSRRLLL